MTEIAVALRETRRSAGRVAPLSIVDGQTGGPRAAEATRGGNQVRAADLGFDGINAQGIADLREEEIRRLLAENARLNERILFLLTLVDREQTRNAELAGVQAALAMDRGQTTSEVRAAVEAEIRPVMLVLLRLLEKRQPDAARAAPAPVNRPAPAPAAMPRVPASSSDGIIDLDAAPG